MNVFNTISSPHYYTKKTSIPSPSFTVSTFANTPLWGYLCGSSMACSSDGKYVAYLTNSSLNTSGSFRIYISSDYGVNYTAKLYDPPSGIDAPSICMSDNGNYILAVTYGSFSTGTYTGRTYVSSDYGNNWTSSVLSSATTANTLGACRMTPDGMYMFVLGFDANTKNIFLCKSSNYGASFTRIYNSGSFLTPRYFGISSNGNYVHIANTNSGTVISSSNGGTSFTTTPSTTFTNIAGVTGNTQYLSICNSSTDGKYVYFAYVTDVAKVLYLYVNNNYGNTANWSLKITYSFSLNPWYMSICSSNRIALLSFWMGGYNGSVYSVYSYDNFNTINVDNDINSTTNGFVYETISSDGYNIYGYATKNVSSITKFIRAYRLY